MHHVQNVAGLAGHEHGAPQGGNATRESSHENVDGVHAPPAVLQSKEGT